jgi:hypothetical protein
MTSLSLKSVLGTLAVTALSAALGNGKTIPDPVNGNYPQTTTPFAAMFGIDDWNTSTLDPYPVTYIPYSTWVGAAQVGTPFADWTFCFAGATCSVASIPPSDLKVNIYSAWAVQNDPVTGLNGVQYARPMYTDNTLADAGGADFEFTYTPNANGDTPNDPTSIHFLQIVRMRSCFSTDDLTCTWTDYRYIFDNGGLGTLFYDKAGGISETIKGTDAQWMLDIPYSCEDQGDRSRGLHTGFAPDCLSLEEGGKLKEERQFQVFVAEQSGTDVILYGGLQWGYIYTNADEGNGNPPETPEPAGFKLVGIGISLLAVKAVFARMCRLKRERSYH